LREPRGDLEFTGKSDPGRKGCDLTEGERMGPIGFIGGTGMVGQPAVNTLLRIGYRPVILTRDPDKLPLAWREAELEARPFDLDHIARDVSALHRLGSLFVAVNPRSAPEHKEAHLAQAVQVTGIERVVRVSVVNADPHAGSPVRRWHGAAERAWEETAIPTLSLRANFFMQSLLRFAPGISKRRSFSAPVKFGSVAFTDALDVSECAATALRGQQLDGHLDVTGPCSYSFHDVARVLSTLCGTPIQFHSAPRDEFIARLMRQPAMTPALTELLAAIYDDIERGNNTGTGDATLRLLGAKPRSLEAFLAEHAESFRPSSSE
jgi:NAD(P)H dehydrogenase (quinone)